MCSRRSSRISREKIQMKEIYAFLFPIVVCIAVQCRTALPCIVMKVLVTVFRNTIAVDSSHSIFTKEMNYIYRDSSKSKQRKPINLLSIPVRTYVSKCADRQTRMFTIYRQKNPRILLFRISYAMSPDTP